MRTGAALHVVLFQLAVRARVALSAAPFHLPVRRGGALYAAVFQRPVHTGSALLAAVFQLPVRARRALLAAVLLLPVRARRALPALVFLPPVMAPLLLPCRHAYSIVTVRNKPRHALRATVCSTRTAESSFEVTFRGTSKADLRGKQKPKTADPPQSTQKIASQDYGCQEEREDGSQNAHSETSPATRTSRKYTRIASSQQGTWRAAIRTQEVPEGDVVSVPGAS